MRERLTYFLLIVAMLATSLPNANLNTAAEECKDIQVIWARGSGQERNDQDYRSFSDELKLQLNKYKYSYSIHEIEYPAIGMELGVALGAKVSAGKSFDYGASVDKGVNELSNTMQSISSACPKTRFVLAGYSQGAQVISSTLQKINSDKVIFAATISDPKLYLPEGFMARACYSSERSDYRTYVPDCLAYQGMLGGYGMQYVNKEDWLGKVGTWCGYYDIVCSSRFDVNSFLSSGLGGIISQHMSYSPAGIYRDVAAKIFNKVGEYFGETERARNFNGTRDVAFVIDSTGSMGWLIEDYKEEALRTAKKVLNDGGRVALYEYRDLLDPFETKLHCGFDDCTLEKFEEELRSIEAFGGGDEKESFLSAAKTVLNGQKWNVGATKSIVLLTDAGFHIPDRDGIGLQDIIVKTKEIDPVHIYVIAPDEAFSNNPELDNIAQATEGGRFSVNEISESTKAITNAAFDNIVFDDGTSKNIETAKINEASFDWANDSSVNLDWRASDALFYTLMVDGHLLGLTTSTSLYIEDITPGSVITITPYGNTGNIGAGIDISIAKIDKNGALDYPKAPSTGVK